MSQNWALLKGLKKNYSIVSSENGTKCTSNPQNYQFFPSTAPTFSFI